jgi:3-oxoacyl-(acyl-carrier-protein) synthase/acyl carrier protein
MALTPRSPHTPIFLFGNSGESFNPSWNAYAIGTGGGAGHFSYGVLASPGGDGTAHAFFDEDTLRVLVADSVESIIGNAIPSDQPLMEAGIDSLGATELQQKLADGLGIELPSTMVFDYPTVDAMTDFLATKVGGATAQVLSPFDAFGPSSSQLGAGSSSHGAAIVSAAGSTSKHPLQSWISGDATTRVPFTRWDVDSAALNDNGDGTLAAQFGVFMPNVENFDAETFGVVRTEAFGMDPQQRLLLHASFEAMAAGGGHTTLSGRPVGSFVGIAATDYESLSHRSGVPISSFSFTAASPSVASGRLAYIFGLRGPAVSIDTACSASLVAAHMACAAFKESHVEAAVAAGVLLCLVPESTMMLVRATMISPEGRSKTLDASADGYVRGEACRALLIKPMSRLNGAEAQAAVGVILGSAVNTNGRASSLTAPNGPAQQILLQEAWYMSGVRPIDVHGLQMHSNGTALGDPIEVGALSAVALEGNQRSSAGNTPIPFVFSTVKGYTGHQESAAGAVGLMEATQLVQLHAVAPALHLRNLNPHVHGSLANHPVSLARGGPYAVPSRQQDGKLLIGVSSFGAQGTNAHALVSGSGGAVTLDSLPSLPLIWHSSRFWVAPRIQSLFTAAFIRKRTKKTSGRGVVVFEVDLATARLAEFWQYGVSKRQCLPSSVLVSMAASAPEMLNTEENSSQVAALLATTLPAPLLLPTLRRNGGSGNAAYSAATIATLTVNPALASAEITFAQQKVLTCKLGSLKIDSATTHVAGSLSSPSCLHGLVTSAATQAVENTAHTSSTAPIAALFSSTAAPFDAATAAGYALHPALLDSAISQFALGLTATATSPPTWIRSIAALVLPSIASEEKDSLVSSYLSATSREHDGWAIGSASLLLPSNNVSASAVHVIELVVGEHNLSPTSPGPYALTTPHSASHARGEIEEAGDDLDPTGTGEAGEDGRLPPDHPLFAMAEEERMLHLQAQVMTEVRNVVGHPIHPEEPLMSSGLDSRGGMELRRTLATALGMQLPVTLLYDYQSIDEIVEYINSVVIESAATVGGEHGTARTADEDDSDYEENYHRATTGGVGATTRGGNGPFLASSAQSQPQVSKLLKTLRPSPTERPLFLAAPGVANAQSAYFSFSTFLQWSTQPIYVLDKDNDLNLFALARQNAADIVAICPEGPYLVGGHSYGGAAAVEIAMVLESWGKEVGLVLIMDTPLTEQIRPGQPQATVATDEDCLELMEMILGALGRDALGMGSSIAHPKESDEWKHMTVRDDIHLFLNLIYFYLLKYQHN